MSDEPAATPAPPSRRRSPYLIAAALLVAVSVVAVLVATKTDEKTVAAQDISNLKSRGPAPALRPEGWLNSEPLAAADLEGKVVVYDFWTYSCVNCVRTIPYLRSWNDRYEKDGLLIVGVHSPEFDFEKDHDNVEKATRKLKVNWPVALDDEMVIWNSFNNLYWPAKYIADREGQIRYFHPGEGNYQESEDVIRKLLGLAADAPRATPPGKTQAEKGADSGLKAAVSPETYLFNLTEGTAPADYPEPKELTRHNAYLIGRWSSSGINPDTGGPGKVRAEGAGAQILMVAIAREVNLVMAPPASGPVDVTVTIDGVPIPEEGRTPDIKVDDEGQTYITVTDSDLYRVLLAPGVGTFEVRLTARSPGLEAFAFTFGS